MSFQMVHMEIAYRVAKMTGIKERAAFILGSVLPDSVHMRDGYSIEQKIRSHLFEGCGPWGAPEDYDRWNSNIREFWDEYGKCARLKDANTVARKVLRLAAAPNG